MNCYECKFRRQVPGSAHSSCAHDICDDVKPLVLLKAAMGYMSKEPIPARVNNQPIVLLSEQGIRGGWALWPIDFDPCWIDQCLLFTPKTPEYIGGSSVKMPEVQSESVWMSNTIIDENTEP